MDNRGLTNSIALFFATIVLGFLLYVVIQPAVEPLLTTAGEHTSRESADAGQSYIDDALTASPFIVVALGTLQLIVSAVFDTRVRP